MKYYPTKKKLVAHLDNLSNSGLLGNCKGDYLCLGQYVLNHGEYDQPDYRPTRYAKGWAAKKCHHYYPGTCNTPQNGPVELSVLIDDFDRERLDDNLEK